MPTPASYSRLRYHTAVRSVDERAIHLQVRQTLFDSLAAPWSSPHGASPEAADASAPRRVLELGAGAGAALESLAAMLGPARWVTVEEDTELLAAARRRIPSWAGGEGFSVRGDDGGGWRLGLEDQVLAVELVEEDPMVFVHETEGAWDLLVVHDGLHLLDPRRSMGALLAAVAPGGLVYFSSVFDGGTAFEPLIDPGFDRVVVEGYHDSLDRRTVGGRVSGDRHAGRHALSLLRAAGATILAAGASDRVVYPVQGGYPSDEAYFLHHELESLHDALKAEPEVGRRRFRRWLDERRDQVERGELVYLSHRLDLLARTATDPAAATGEGS